MAAAPRSPIRRIALSAIGACRDAVRAVKKHGLAAHVAGKLKIGIARHSDVDRLEIEPAGRRSDGLVGRLRGVNRERLAAGRQDDAPGPRHPLGREIEGLLVDVRQADLAQPGDQPLSVLAVGGSPDDSAPVFRMPAVAIAAGNRRLCGDVFLQFPAVDRRVRLSAGADLQAGSPSRVRAGSAGPAAAWRTRVPSGFCAAGARVSTVTRGPLPAPTS